MKAIKSMVALSVVVVALTATDALAEQCSGYVTSKALDPILMREAPDGSKVVWISSEGIFIVSEPADHPANLVNRVCGGGFKIASDGKSAAAVGTCSYADLEGDAFHLSWQSTFVEGTWTISGGTGKFEKFTGQGTFRPAKKYDNSWSVSMWEGECSLPK
jgi:hypothetical protein